MRITAPASVLATTVIALALAGCSAADAEPAPTVTVTETITASPEPAPAPTADQPLAYGESASVTQAGLTVHGVNLDPAPTAPEPQSPTDKWVSADIEICNESPEGFNFSAATWSLVDSENRSFEQSSLGYNQFPQPDYAFGDEYLAAGDCHRGWLTFVANETSTFVEVEYRNTLGEGASWAIS